MDKQPHYHLIQFDGDSLFHNNCRPITSLSEWPAAMSRDEVFSDLMDWFELYFSYECGDVLDTNCIFDYETDKEKSEEEQVKEAVEYFRKMGWEKFSAMLDKTWQDGHISAYALLEPTDMAKLICILRRCGEDAWEYSAE